MHKAIISSPTALGRMVGNHLSRTVSKKGSKEISGTGWVERMSFLPEHKLEIVDDVLESVLGKIRKGIRVP